MSNGTMSLLEELSNGRQNLLECCTNLESVADYCMDNYNQVGDKKHAFQETMNYTTQSLGSVAYQINLLASNFLAVLGQQTDKLKDLEGKIHQLNMHVNIHQEKVARRSIGSYTTQKDHVVVRNMRNPGLVYPDFVEKPTKYVRRSINYNIYDDIGHGVKLQDGSQGGLQTMTRRSSGSDNPIYDRQNSRSSSLGHKAGGEYAMRCGMGGTMGRNTGMGTLNRTANIAPHQPVNPPNNYAVSMPAAPNLGGQPAPVPNNNPIYMQSRRSSGSSLNSQQQPPIQTTAGQQPQRQMSQVGGQQQQNLYYQQSGGGMPSQYMQGQQAPVYSTGGSVTVPPNPYQTSVGMVPASANNPYNNTPQVSSSNPYQSSAGMTAVVSSNPYQPATAVVLPSPSPANIPAPPNLNNMQQAMQPENNMQYQQDFHELPPPPSRDSSGYNRHQDFPPATSPGLPPPPFNQQLSESQEDAAMVMPPPPPQQYTGGNTGNYGYPVGGYQNEGGDGIAHLQPQASDHMIAKGGQDEPWAPDTYIQKVYSMYEYTQDKNDELTFPENALIYVIKKNDDGWWEGVMEGVTGLFPGNYVEPADEP